MSAEKIMEQAQVFASAWSVVGGPFDDGAAMEAATREKDELRRMVAELVEERDAMARALDRQTTAAERIAQQVMASTSERDALAARLAELEGQEPTAWMNAKRDMASFIHFHEDDLPLYARPVPAELSPDFTDTARAALLWVLWHHQGGSSPVGQPIRYAMGMDAHERLSEHQVQEAKRWAALTKSESTDFRQARTAPAEPVNVDFGKRGENMFFKIDNQSFLLEYKPEEQDEFEFMKAMLLSAFSRITHGVKTESQPVNARLLDALKRAKDSLVAFKFVPEHANCWEASDEENLTAVNSAIAAAEAQQERLLHDMHDAGREIDRVMAEPEQKAVRLTEAEIAKALASAGLKPEDYREDGEILPLVVAIEAAALRKNGIEVAE